MRMYEAVRFPRGNLVLGPDKELVCALPSMEQATAYADALNRWASSPPLPGMNVPDRIGWDDTGDLEGNLIGILDRIHGPAELWQGELDSFNGRGMFGGDFQPRIDTRAGLDVDLEVNGV